MNRMQCVLGELESRINAAIEDAERAAKALSGIQGKRLTYRRTNEAQNK